MPSRSYSVGAMSLTWWNCGRGVASGRMRAGQENHHRVACAAEVGGDQLGVLERRIAGPGPAGMVHVVHRRPSQRREAAERLHRIQVLLHGAGDGVLRQQFADRAALPFGRGAVVADHETGSSVLSRRPSRSTSATTRPAWASTCSRKPAKTSISRHWKGRSASGMLSQPAMVAARGVSWRRRDPALRLLPGEDAVPHGIPAIVEAAFVLVGPCLEDVLRLTNPLTNPLIFPSLVPAPRARVL